MKPLRIFTPVFGPKHIGLFKTMIASLTTTLNWIEISEAKWCLFVHQSEIDQVRLAFGHIPAKIEIIQYGGSMADLVAKRGVLMCEAFVKVMDMCIKDGSQLLVSCPDFVWSDGSIPNMRKFAEQTNVCVSVPHMRVLPNIFENGFTTKPVELVGLAMKYPHASWTMSEHGKHFGTHKGAILWRKIRDGLITFQHRMPSPFLINPIQDDLKYFTTNDAKHLAAWGAIDHSWAEHLCKSQRWRYCLSSDLGFMAEITDPEKNIPPPTLSLNNAHPDDFWTQERGNHLLHQRYNRLFVATLRYNAT